jgi:hypothetical protein
MCFLDLICGAPKMNMAAESTVLRFNDKLLSFGLLSFLGQLWEVRHCADDIRSIFLSMSPTLSAREIHDLGEKKCSKCF